MMDSLREQILILISTPFYLLVIGLEFGITHYHKPGSYSLRNTLQNTYLMLVNGGIDFLFRGVYIGIILTYCYHHRFGEVKNPWLYWPLLFIFEDFMYYWLHRVDHACRFFWATHVTHHSSDLFNLTVGFRSSVMEPLYRFGYFIPIAWAGFRPLDIAFAYSVTQIWGILVHTNYNFSLGWLDHILVTPSHHRVHHASNTRYLDKNMGMMLIIWDRLFGTFQKELPASEYEPLKYGLTKQILRETPATLIFHEWAAIANDLKRSHLSLRDKWGYLFGPPGWSHDGSSQTSRELRHREMGKIPGAPAGLATRPSPKKP
jgi:sterol desaturase/sphingolipid hydroxylase (fatty acid hydroxylase superfamily)